MSPPTEDQSQDAVVEIFNKLAADRVEHRDNWTYMTSKQLTDFALLDMADVNAADVLNVGCFYPIDEILFAHRVKSWTATDLGEETIRIAQDTARAALSDRLFERLSFQVADGTALPFEDATFDVTVSMSTVDHVPDGAARQQFINEMARVTRPGGRVVLTVPNRWNRVYARRADLAASGSGAPEFFEYCFSPVELRRMVHKTGMRIVAFTSTSEIPIVGPRPFLPRLDRRPLLAAWNAISRHFGARMGVLAIKE
jgi:SAM-dependent methyltransferase